jgi:pimeloyl-ACP methyl ester carboxylesterase
MTDSSVRGVKFGAAGESIVGTILTATPNEKPTILILHGAGHSSKERALPLAAALLARYGVGSLVFDFPGHGESSGELANSSISQRLEVAREACKFFAEGRPEILFGFSMGGHVALELLNEQPVATLGLFCGAVYADRAKNVKFDSGFTDFIREKDSWRNTAVTENLREFTGMLFIAIGEEDKAIPDGVVEALDEAAGKTSAKTILRLPGIGHQLAKEMAADPQLMSLVVEKLGPYVT